MSLAEAMKAEHVPAPGAVAFLSATRRPEACVELRARRYLVANAGGAAPTCGQVRRAIDDAVEGALALRGAHPPSVDLLASAEETVRDQVFRARLLGVAGVALIVPPLTGAAEGEEHLAFDDSAAIAAWIRASERAAVSIFFDESDRDLRLLLPVRLGDRVPFTPSRPRMVEPLPKEPVVEALVEPVVESLALAEPVVEPVVEPVAETPAPPSDVPPSGEVARSAPAIEAIVALAALPELPSVVEPPPAPEPPAPGAAEPPPPPVMALPRRGVLKKRPRPEAPPAEAAADDSLEPQRLETQPLELQALEPQPLELQASVEPPAPEPVAAAPATRFMRRVPPLRVAERLAEPALAEAEALPREEAALRVVNAAEWRNHAVDLDKAKGPKPVAVIERLFTTRYMPLLGASARGEVDISVRTVIDAWRSNFEHSYREAYSALRVTGKRPPMVFDVPDIAARISRLNGARATKLFLVDAMRFDIGERVAQLLAERLVGRAVCVERMVLWAAIPTTTATQMALLARGEGGMREAGPTSEPEPEITRGRAVGTVRRERAGSREIMKLDLVEARVRGAGAGYAERIEALAEEVVQATVRYVETLPPRTLLFLFGDHGFRFGSSADGRATGPATQGGVSPEEVLVPGQAWLIGGVH